MEPKNSQTKSERGFDAVGESRRWKEAVAAETAGLGLHERMAWFRRQSSVAAIRAREDLIPEESMLREEPPGDGRRP
jgi:hypothetical protein